MKPENSYLSRRLRSFQYALNGWVILIKDEPNARIHLSAAVIVIIMGFYFKLNQVEWLFICVAITLVFAFEMINSALENLCDQVSESPHPLIKKAKDLSAGAVLISAVAALIMGVLVFYKYL